MKEAISPLIFTHKFAERRIEIRILNEEFLPLIWPGGPGRHKRESTDEYEHRDLPERFPPTRSPNLYACELVVEATGHEES